MVLIPDSLNIENMSLRHPQTTLLELGMLIPKLDKVEIKKRSKQIEVSLNLFVGQLANTSMVAGLRWQVGNMGAITSIPGSTSLLKSPPCKCVSIVLTTHIYIHIYYVICTWICVFENTHVYVCTMHCHVNIGRLQKEICQAHVLCLQGQARWKPGWGPMQVAPPLSGKSSPLKLHLQGPSGIPHSWKSPL